MPTDVADGERMSMTGNLVPYEAVADDKQSAERVVRTIRIEQDVWDALDQAARDAGMDRSALLRQLARWFVGVPGAQLPPRRGDHD